MIDGSDDCGDCIDDDDDDESDSDDECDYFTDDGNGDNYDVCCDHVMAASLNTFICDDEPCSMTP